MASGLSVDVPVLVSMVLIVATVFFLYLLIRRTLIGFREGFESGGRGKDR
jgi:hypothetical protein